MKCFILFLTILFLTIQINISQADQDGECGLRGGGKALYHCPEHYDVIIAGNDTDLCDGRCYKIGNQVSAKKAVMAIYKQFGVSMSDENIRAITTNILRGSCSYGINYKGDRISICPGRAIK